MKLELKVLQIEYKTRAKKLLRRLDDYKNDDLNYNYELGRLHELNKVISELKRICKKSCL